MNFHTTPIKGFLYEGDVNIEYGGEFIKDVTKEVADAFSKGHPYVEWVTYVKVEEWDAMDYQWLLTSGKVLVELTDETMEVLAREMDLDRNEPEPENFLLASLIHGKKEVEIKELVQFGKLDEYSSSKPSTPDKVLHKNTKIHNVVKAFVKEHA